MGKPILSEEDKQRVKDYLENNPLHKTERQPFRIWRLLLVLIGVVSLLSAFSIVLANFYFYA